MPGPKPKYPMQFLDNQIAQLRQPVNSPKALQGKVRRARITLAAHEQPAWSTQAFFPLKCALRPRPWPAACPKNR